MPVDGSPASMRAVDMGIEFSQKDGSKLSLLYVVMLPVAGLSGKVLEEIKKVGESALDAAQQRCDNAGVRASRLLRIAEGTSTAYEINDVALDGKYDCVILGSRGYAGECGILMGSVGVSLAISLPCTTIIVR